MKNKALNFKQKIYTNEYVLHILQGKVNKFSQDFFHYIILSIGQGKFKKQKITCYTGYKVISTLSRWSLITGEI